MMRAIGIYAIGSVGSRLITFMLVPIYSFFIAPESFGYYDLCFMALLVMMPFISLQLRDGAFRFLIDADSDAKRRQVVTFTVLTLLRNAAICVLIGILLSVFTHIPYMWHTIAFAVAFTFTDVVAQMLRALGHNALFATQGIICSTLIFCISVPLVAFAGMGIEGIFIGNIAARIITLLYVEFKVRIFSNYFAKNADTKLLRREIMRFSLPLIAVNVIIWGLSSGNRFFIKELIGVEANGLYAVAQKFAAILEALALIITLVWQETAIKQYDAPDRNSFFSRVLNCHVWALSALTIGISFGAKILYPWIIGPEYQASVSFVFPLVLSAMLVSVTLFLDVIYQCAKATSRQIPGLIIATAISLLGNYFLTLQWGIYGILLTLNLAYLSLIAIRAIDSRRFVRMRVTGSAIATIALLLVSLAAFYMPLPVAMQIAYLAVAVVLLLCFCPADIRRLVASKLHLKNKNL